MPTTPGKRSSAGPTHAASAGRPLHRRLVTRQTAFHLHGGPVAPASRSGRAVFTPLTSTRSSPRPQEADSTTVPPTPRTAGAVVFTRCCPAVCGYALCRVRRAPTCRCSPMTRSPRVSTAHPTTLRRSQPDSRCVYFHRNHNGADRVTLARYPSGRFHEITSPTFDAQIPTRHQIADGSSSSTKETSGTSDPTVAT